MSSAIISKSANTKIEKIEVLDENSYITLVNLSSFNDALKQSQSFLFIKYGLKTKKINNRTCVTLKNLIETQKNLQEIYDANPKYNVGQSLKKINLFVKVTKSYIADSVSKTKKALKLKENLKLSVFNFISKETSEISFLSIYEEFKLVYQIADGDLVNINDFKAYIDAKKLKIDPANFLSITYLIGLGEV